MSSLAYIWMDGAVHVVERPTINVSASDSIYQRALMVDDRYETIPSRYGKYTGGVWEQVPLELFPAEFRLNLLLMGIT